MKKIFMLLFTAAALVCFCFTAQAEETEMSYYVEYEGDQATVYFQSESLSAFDFGFIYDPEEVTIEDIVYSDYYHQLEESGSVLAVENPKAQDEEGNTYVVVTGVAMNGSNGEPIQFSSMQEIAHIVVSGVSAGDVIGVVTQTAAVDDVRNANQLAAVDLEKQQEVTDSDIFAGAKEESKDNAGSNENAAGEDNNDVMAINDTAKSDAGNTTWIYVLVIAAVVILVAILIFVSKKGRTAGKTSGQENEGPAEDANKSSQE